MGISFFAFKKRKKSKNANNSVQIIVFLHLLIDFLGLYVREKTFKK